jgi:cysteine synthase
MDDPGVGSILEAIGDTPLVRVEHCAPPNGAQLWLKLEYCNPTGSMKDRMALAMIEGAINPSRSAVDMTQRLATEDGIFAGISTGANVVGAHRLAERLGPDSVVVTPAVDTGFKYGSVAPYADLSP